MRTHEPIPLNIDLTIIALGSLLAALAAKAVLLPTWMALLIGLLLGFALNLARRVAVTFLHLRQQHAFHPAWLITVNELAHTLLPDAVYASIRSRILNTPELYLKQVGVLVWTGARLLFSWICLFPILLFWGVAGILYWTPVSPGEFLKALEGMPPLSHPSSIQLLVGLVATIAGVITFLQCVYDPKRFRYTNCFADAMILALRRQVPGPPARRRDPGTVCSTCRRASRSATRPCLTHTPPISGKPRLGRSQEEEGVSPLQERPIMTPEQHLVVQVPSDVWRNATRAPHACG